MISPIPLVSSSRSALPAVHILHENGVWVEPLREQLIALSIPFHEWFLDEVELDLLSLPPEGVFYNRMSASSHTRDHRFAWEATRGVVAWLQANGRRVINNRQATALEVSKVEQVIALRDHGLLTPHTVAVTGVNALKSATSRWDRPFIVKPNRGGKGTGVTLIRTSQELDSLAKNFDTYTLDGTVVLQEYVKPLDGRVLRLEFIGGQHFYTVSIDAGGGFELCPSDACQVGAAHCPADGRSRFEILADHNPDELDRCQAFLREVGMDVAAMEAVADSEGQLRFYDVNINTNYNARAEAAAGHGRQGMRAIAEYLGAELAQLPLSSMHKTALS